MQKKNHHLTVTDQVFMIPVSNHHASEKDSAWSETVKKTKATLHLVILMTAVLFISSIAHGQFVAKKERTGEKRGSINLTLGYAESNDLEKGNFGLLKSVGWNLLSGWVSAGVNFGIIKNEIMLMGNVCFIIPLNRIEPFVTAGYGFILETFHAVDNYGAGLRIRLGKSIGIVTEYRKLNFEEFNKTFNTGGITSKKTKTSVDYFGAGIFYYF
jgi:hypothetical protein